MRFLGAIEAGGTKFVCAIGNENGEVIEKASFPTEKTGTDNGKCHRIF